LGPSATKKKVVSIEIKINIAKCAQNFMLHVRRKKYPNRVTSKKLPQIDSSLCHWKESQEVSIGSPECCLFRKYLKLGRS